MTSGSELEGIETGVGIGIGVKALCGIGGKSDIDALLRAAIAFGSTYRPAAAGKAGQP